MPLVTEVKAECLFMTQEDAEGRPGSYMMELGLDGPDGAPLQVAFSRGERGVAHVVELQLDGHPTQWFGLVNVTRAVAPMSVAWLWLATGRAAPAVVTGFVDEFGATEDDPAGVGCVVLRLAGVSPLAEAPGLPDAAEA